MEQAQKMRRRRIGRKDKLVSDIQLLLGNQMEAMALIDTATQELDRQNDYIWLGYSHITRAAINHLKKISIPPSGTNQNSIASQEEISRDSETTPSSGFRFNLLASANSNQ